MLSRYETLKELGSGTHGTVLLVRDTFENPNDWYFYYAMKRSLDFPLEEVKALTSLEHKSIPRLHEVFHDGDFWCLIMDYIDGPTLRQYSQQQRDKLAFEDVRSIGLSLCSVLDYIHCQGFIHRDVMPTNIMFSKAGSLYLIDFSTVTSAGPYDFAGSRRYSAPEQQTPGEIDHRVDIYSLGVVLHELVTGTVTPLEPEKVIEGCASSNENRKLRELCLRMMEIDPEKRPQRILEVMRLLLRI